MYSSEATCLSLFFVPAAPLLRIRPCHLEDDYLRSKLHPGIKIDDILIDHADTPGRDGLADTIWLRGSVNAVSCVFPVFEQIERTRAKRIADAAFHAFGPFRVACWLSGNHGAGRRPMRPFLLLLHCAGARKGKPFASDANAVSDRPTVLLNEVEEAVMRINDDGADWV